MKIFLRNRATKEFYAGPGQWVRELNKALSFNTAEAAREVLTISQAVDLLYTFTDPRHNFLLTLGDPPYYPTTPHDPFRDWAGDDGP